MKNQNYQVGIIKNIFGDRSDRYNLMVTISPSLFRQDAFDEAEKVALRYEAIKGNLKAGMISCLNYGDTELNKPIGSAERLSIMEVPFTEHISAGDSMDGKASLANVDTIVEFDSTDSWANIYNGAEAYAISTGSKNNKAQMSIGPICADEHHIELTPPIEISPDKGDTILMELKFYAGSVAFDVAVNKPFSEELWKAKSEVAKTQSISFEDVGILYEISLG